MSAIFDTHAHYDSEQFDGLRGDILDSLPEKGVGLVLNCGSDLASSERSIALSRQYSYVYAAAGIHPEEADALPPDWEQGLRALLACPKVAAVGEIGLDYHYTTDNRERQKALFRREIEIANELSLPVIVHDRDAHEDTFEILSALRPRGVLHCYSGSAEQARQYAAMGFYLGFGGAATFKNARKPIESARAIPLSQLLLETDCPYMAPVPFRGKLCTSDMISYTAAVLGPAVGLETGELIALAAENGRRLFSIGGAQ